MLQALCSAQVIDALASALGALPGLQARSRSSGPEPSGAPRRSSASGAGGAGEAPRGIGPAEFERLLAEVEGPLLGYCLRLTRDRGEAEELRQEAVYRAYRGRGGFQPGTSFRSWVFRIATNAFISGRRSARRAPTSVGELDAAAEPRAPEPSRPIEPLALARDWARLCGDQLQDELKRALEELPEAFRLPLLLNGLGDLRYQEVADALAVPVGTVMSRIFRARQRLRQSLGAWRR